MNATERRAVTALSTIMSLRMVGLFMVLPLFTLYAKNLSGATPFLLGLALGVYGLMQALLQIPFGALSDRLGRKPMIIIGLTIFIAGSLLAGYTHTITGMIIGRAMQGMGAVGSTILAMMADLTREDQRTKAMAIAGISIGFSFSIAMFLGPVLIKWLTVNHLFYLAALFGLMAIGLVLIAVPTPHRLCFHRDTEPEFTTFFKLLSSPTLAKLNSGIFILHALFTASFVVIPISLLHFTHFSANRQWLIYLPTLLIAFLISLTCIGIAERKQQVKPYFLSSIVLLIASEILLWLAPTHTILVSLGLFCFFAGFSTLEAFMPSLISRTAPAARKGSALGIYSCAQFFGIFVGGIAGGWLYGEFSFTGVYVFCTILALGWLVLSLFMQPPLYLVNQIWRLSADKLPEWHKVVSKLQDIPGVVEIVFIAEDSTAYLKLEREATKHPDFIQLKAQLVEVPSSI